ncbi:hypothetical protein MCOR22_002764 [Pyricularia oryzae]|uniref:Uncharacterized protein n=1 Tax=Pyricularia grisea TaxID=148305 RepID=A0ABQ8NGP5_PYRGI|nr:hypothetical protein MCOR33_006680 [Pyricularia grisea]KAI6448511.1 hypothetical protein MCOR22_002764 [Pyricularia oryzae]KAI6462712.1 hypothetical protein MCOR15_004490 [Pyricularia oryzae]KAI6503903.1 hypothetical protein MCOR11_000368 [Pyricularia oryzae]KAI6531959.1 hypothetical protein MCOR16_004080 [Pyricularia oryzae]
MQFPAIIFIALANLALAVPTPTTADAAAPLEAREPKILRDSKGKPFDDSIFKKNGQLIACPPNQQC